VGVLVGLMIAAFLLVAWSALRPSSVPAGDPAAAAAFLAGNRSADDVVQTASGLQYRVIQPGSGPTPTDRDVTSVTYTGSLTNGTVFDQSRTPTPLPVADVVPGFAEALKLMPRGARYRVWIGPELGYGARTMGPIPGNSVLVFDIDMIDFKAAQATR